MKNSFKELKIENELVAKRAELRKKYFDFRFQAIVRSTSRIPSRRGIYGGR